MTLRTALSSPPSAPSGGFRQVLAVVDLDAPVEPVVRRAVAESFAHSIPLQVVVLYPRIPFTADPAVAAHAVRRLGHEQRRVVAAVTAAARASGLDELTLRLVPLGRIPLWNRRRQAQRTVMTQLRQQPASLLVAAEQHTPDAEPIPTAVGPEPTTDVRSFERIHA
jgi:hypothetical protein